MSLCSAKFFQVLTFLVREMLKENIVGVLCSILCIFVFFICIAPELANFSTFTITRKETTSAFFSFFSLFYCALVLGPGNYFKDALSQHYILTASSEK